MDKDTRITGIAWRFKKWPSIEEYKAFLDRPDAILRIVRTDGQIQARIPLAVVPHTPEWDDHAYVFPEMLLAGGIERWDTPEWVWALRLSLADGTCYWLYKEDPLKDLAQKR